SGVDSRCWIRR
ncbi:hypothetical protein STRIP9103_01310, partial [Streptomyces ipomoeae 91-03]